LPRPGARDAWPARRERWPVMDALDRVADAGRDLLARVDAALLAGGAPSEDPIWPLLRRVGALPGDALHFAAGLDPEPMTATASELRACSRAFAERREDLAAHVAAEHWTGAGADAFTATWRALADHIGAGVAPDEDSLSGRLLAQASY